MNMQCNMIDLKLPGLKVSHKHLRSDSYKMIQIEGVN